MYACTSVILVIAKGPGLPVDNSMGTRFDDYVRCDKHKDKVF